MLSKLIDRIGLDKKACAGLLGVTETRFSEWVAGQQPIPESMRELVSVVLGVKPDDLLHDFSGAKAEELDKRTPSIWFKLREPRLTPKDKEYAFLIRFLAYNVNGFEETIQRLSPTWKVLFDTIRAKIDFEESPTEQGKYAARLFRRETALDKRKEGIGEKIRPILRDKGVLVLECPMAKSEVEGFCFMVGSGESQRPATFVNTWARSWFRRNEILSHELGHAIFDVPTQVASFDFKNGEPEGIPEARAQAFAQELLIPTDLLNYFATKYRTEWEKLTPYELAVLSADTHVEPLTVLKAASQAGLISPELHEQYRNLDTWAQLRKLSPHAMTAKELLERGEIKQSIPNTYRETTLTRPKLRLPIPFMQNVLSAWRSEDISNGKAAELLLMDERDFLQRFASVQE